MKRIFLLLLSLTSLAFGIPTGNTYTVTSNLDPAVTSGAINATNGTITSGTGVGTVTLRSAVIAANMSGAGPHVINVPAGLGTYNLSAANPTNSGTTATNGMNDLQIGSDGSTITMQGTGGTAKIVQTVALNDVLTTGFKSDGFTPAIVTLTLDHLEVTGGTVTGIFVGADDGAGHRSNTTITNCNIHDNSNGNSVYGQGGALQDTTGNLTISNTTFANNSATHSVTGQGGAIYYSIPNAAGLQGVVGSLSITNCTFTGNHAALASGIGGGAIYVNVISAAGANGTNTAITGNTFSSNTCTASADGGAIAVDGNREVDILRNTFVTNGVSGSGHGGAISVNNGPTFINYNRFFGNTASTATNGTALNHTTGNASAVDATENWWASNTGPVTNAVTGATSTTSPYLKLTNTASPTSVSILSPNNTTTVTASFLADSASGAVSTANLSQLIGQSITLGSPVLGTLSGSDTSLQANGKAVTTFTAGPTPGSGSSTATFDGVAVVAPITVTAPDMTVTMSHTGNFIQGQTGKTYTITPTNSGNAVTGGTVSVSITLPAGLTATGLTGTGWTIDSTTTAHRSDALATGTSYPLTLTVDVAANASSPLATSATVSGGGEVVTNNDVGTDSTIVLSTDATLTSLTPSLGTLSPVFDSTTGTYFLDLPAATTLVKVTPTVHQANATVKVNTVTVASGVASGDISVPLSSATAISVVVTAQDTVTTKTYTLNVRHAPAFTSANSATFTMGSSGSFTFTTSGYPSASGAMTLSQTGAFPNSLTFTDNGNGTATLVGTPQAGQGGIYTLNLGANNGVGTAATQTFTLTVNEAPTINSSIGATFTQGVNNTFQVTTSGFPIATLAAFGTLPSGITFTDNGNDTATFSGIPAVGTAGSHPFTITANNGIGTQATQNFTLTIKPAVDHFIVSAPGTATAGTAFNVTVTAQDNANATASTYTGTVHFTSTDAQAGLPSDYTFVAGDNGVHVFSVTLKTAGSKTVSVADTTTLTATGTSGSIAVSAAGATKLAVSAPSSATAGVGFNFTATAQDSFGNTDTGYTGTIHFTSSDGSAVLPANATLTNGVGTFSVTLKTSGSRTITATDTVTPSITGTSGGIAVSAAAATHLAVSAPSSATAGTAFSITVTAQDAFNNTATGYVGTVHFTSTDGGFPTLPANYTFTGGDNGVHTFTVSVTLTTAGLQTVTATDAGTSSITGTSGSITVGAAAATHLAVSTPSTATAGTSFSTLTVTAKDPYNNTATSYTGTVHFTSTDGAATLPVNYTFVAGDNGVHTFSATLKTTGNQTITATDTVTGGINGTSPGVAVSAGAATHFTVSAPSSSTAGTSFTVTVTALDAFNNTATGYVGSAHFTSTDGSATLPANYTFVVGDNGVHTFASSATLDTAGAQTVTATDTVTGSITGTSGSITVSAGAATHFAISAPSSATAGTAFNFTVTAKDAFNNTATAYAGTVHSTSSDGSATLPSNSTLTSGTGTFSATLKAGGNQTITATDTVTGSITGTSGNIAVQPVADLSITKTDGVTTATPGGSVTYTITVSNAGPSAVTGATVADTFPAFLTATWTAVGAGGGTAPASGSGNINTSAVNLPVGGSVTFTVSATISPAATGTLSNTATVSVPGGVTDPNTANNSATDTDTLTPSADLAITMTDGVTTATPGGSVTYTITASNPGPSNATGVTIADTFPASLTATWTAVGAGGATVTPSGSGNINTPVNLPAGGSVTFTVSASIAPGATGTLSNTATVTAPGGVTDPTPGNNSATDTDTLTPSADLAITMTDGVTTATPGGSVTYTITASNAGPSNATGVTVADTFPAALTATWTAVGAGGGTVTGSGSGNINTPVNLPAGGSVTFTVSATIASGATGTLSNTATVTAPGGVTDPTPGNNSATDTDTLAAQADLAITVTDGVTTATPGGSVTYTITASNAGPSNATGVTVADTFPAALTATWTAVGAGGGTVAPSGSGNINTSVNLPAGGSVTFTVSATISPAATGTLSNTASVTAPAGVTDPTPGNNSATDTDTLAPQADLAITKTDGVTTATPGGSVTYTITASNAGPSNASGVTIADTLPASLTATWTAVGAGGGTATASGSGNINDTVNLPAGGSVTYTVTATIASSATGSLSNTATVTAPPGVTDPTPGNNSATDTDTLVRKADLAITMTDSPDPVNATQNVTYTIDVVNNGPSDSSTVSVSDVLPPNTTFVSTTASAGWSSSTPSVGGTGTVTFSKSAVANAGTGHFTIVAKVDLLAPNNSTLSNTATVSATETDPSGGNNSATSTTLVKSGADLAISGSASTPVVAGTDVTYTFTATNNGPLDADTAVVTDVLPTGTTFVSVVTPAGWSLNSAPAVGANGTVIFNAASFANGASASFTVVAHVNSDVPAATVLHNGIAASSATLDIFPLNSSASLDSTVTTKSDLAVTLSAAPNPVIVGGNVTYTIGVTNNGPSDATGVNVSVPLPAAVTFVSSTASGGWSTSAPSVGSGGTVSFTKAALANAASGSFTIVAKVKTGTSNGTIVSATASVSSTGTDPVSSNDTAPGSFAVGTVDPTPVQIGTTGTLNKQNGLFELAVTITNTTPNSINGFRLHVDFSAYKAAYPSLRLYNSTSGPSSPDVYVDYPYPLPVDGAVTMKLLFYTSSRTFPSPFTPILTVEKLAVSQVSDTNGMGVQASFRILPDGTHLLEFPSVIGRWYRVRYSADMTNWFDCPVPIQASGTKTQFIDAGPPYTNISPADPSVHSRFYIVNQIATP